MAPRPLHNKKKTEVPQELAAILQRPLVRPVNLENLVRKEYDRRGRRLPLRDAKGRFISTYQAFLNEQIRARTLSPATTQESSRQVPNDRPIEGRLMTKNEPSRMGKTKNTLDTVTSIPTDIYRTVSLVSLIAVNDEFPTTDQTQSLVSTTDDDKELIELFGAKAKVLSPLTETIELPVEITPNSLTKSLKETQTVTNTTQSSVQPTQSELSIVSTALTTPLIGTPQTDGEETKSLSIDATISELIETKVPQH